MIDLSLNSRVAIHLKQIATLAQQGLDDRRYAEARAEYRKIQDLLPAEKLAELWSLARTTQKAGDQSSVMYWLKVYGNEADRRYQIVYRMRPAVKAKRAKAMALYIKRPEVKRARAEYMKRYRANKKKGLEK